MRRLALIGSLLVALGLLVMLWSFGMTQSVVHASTVKESPGSTLYRLVPQQQTALLSLKCTKEPTTANPTASVELIGSHFNPNVSVALLAASMAASKSDFLSISPSAIMTGSSGSFTKQVQVSSPDRAKPLTPREPIMIGAIDMKGSIGLAQGNLTVSQS